jgi:hypothetical protein
MKTQKTELPKGAPLPGGAPTTGQDNPELPEFASGNGFDPKSDQAGINRQDPITPGDVFANLEGRRLRQSFDRLKTRKPLTTVGIRKPKAHEWFQAHSTFRLEWVLFKAEEEGLNEEWFFPATEEVLAALETLSIKGVKNCMIFWWINRKGNTFIWPVQLADADGRQNEWHASMFEMMSIRANGQWARIEAGDSGYEVTIAEPEENENAPKPDWPPVDTFGDVLRVAFKKGGRVIEHLDHPLLNRLRG